MSLCPPFHIVPWDTDFLNALKTGILTTTNQQPGKATVIFMHDRPKRYLAERFRTDESLSRPLLLPRTLTGAELISAFRLAETASLRHEAGRLDRVALLLSCVQEQANTDSTLCTQLSQMGAAGFFPWGLQLADLMEECLIQGLTPENLRHTEGDVAPFGAALLGALGELFKRYIQALDTRHLTTPGLEAYTLAATLKRDEEHPLPDFLCGRSIFLAGFGTLTDTENTIFRYLWRQGAQVYLHVDPALAEGQTGHWACTGQRQWLEQWGAKTLLDCPPAGRTRNCHYFSGYDLHTQLEALSQDLSTLDESLTNSASEQNGTAVVLTHSDILLPVLHQLPRKDCNISLGYPLERSLLFQLVEQVLTVRDRMRPDGSVHWKALADLVRHPYLRQLESEGRSLRKVFQCMERRLRTGRRFVVPRELGRLAIMDALADITPISPALTEQTAFLSTILQAVFETWKNAATLRQIGDALAVLCDTLITFGSGQEPSLWTRFPLDAEGLFRLMQKVIPELRDNDMAEVKLPWPLLRNMLIQTARAERVPFEADPLTGLQVLGMLETRLLRFPRIFLLDVTDDQLPGPPVRSPLLPDTLRTVLGLPDTRNRELLSAYTFYRLLAGADEVWLYWQEGVESSGLFDSKKQRSRFIEELIWEEEQRRGACLEPGGAILRTTSPRMTPPRRTPQAIPKTPVIAQQLALFMEHPLSATALDGYLRCPLQFYFERLCGLRPLEEVAEDDDPAQIGDILHETLQAFYEPGVSKTLTMDAPELAFSRLRALFFEKLTASSLPENLPPEGLAMLKVSGPGRLETFLKKQPEPIRILSLETSMQAPLAVCGQTYSLYGKLDCVDWRTNERGEEGSFITDYKTGHIHPHDSGIWEDTLFWESLEPDEQAGETPEKDQLAEIVTRIPSIQLLFYAYLYTRTTHEPILNAAFIELAKEGESHYLFDPEFSADEREAILETKSIRLLKYILAHMRFCPEFRPHTGKHCDWCSVRDACMRSQTEEAGMTEETRSFS